ncbi:MAG: hypothetical protein A2X86_04525 [Bdellovibrionales bacterium GWA2_49_15]|nr:MAG: hypothetical protein A2X86_04525 [Bdellovibrionales bacterium GWA2_49_15]
MAKTFFLVLMAFLSFTLAPASIGFEIPKTMLLEKEKLVFFAPNIINPKYFCFEFGFRSHKKIERFHYPYNAFAEAFVEEEAYTTSPDLRAGALGFKGGVILPTQPWINFSLQFSLGYAKTALHEDPWFGKREKSHTIHDMFLVEAGAMYRYKTILLRFIYQETTLKYFTRKTFISFGVNF